MKLQKVVLYYYDIASYTIAEINEFIFMDAHNSTLYCIIYIHR